MYLFININTDQWTYIYKVMFGGVSATICETLLTVFTCYRGGSCTASLVPQEGAIPWILTIPIRTPVPIIPHTWDWLIIHTCCSFTHTHISHTQTPCKVLICPGCLFWALYPSLISVYLTLDCFLLFWLSSACPTSDRFTWTVFASHLPWSFAWNPTLSLSNPCCSALPVFDPLLSDYSY